MKTTFYLNFDLYKVFKQLGNTFKCCRLTDSLRFTCKLVIWKNLVSLR